MVAKVARLAAGAELRRAVRTALVLSSADIFFYAAVLRCSWVLLFGKSQRNVDIESLKEGARAPRASDVTLAETAPRLLCK